MSDTVYVNGKNDLVLQSEDDVGRDEAAFWTQRLIAAWIARCTTRPAIPDIKKQGAAARRLVESRPLDQIAAALRGIEQIAPFSMGQMWDLFDLERRFAVAAQMGCGPSLEEAKADRVRRTLMDALNANTKPVHRRIPAMVREIPSRT